MTFDADGGCIVCEHVDELAWSAMDPTARARARCSPPTSEGKELNSPNDVVVAVRRRDLVHRPTYGRMPGFGIEREQELDFQGVYRIPPAAATRSCSPTTSSSPTACASRPTSRCSTSTTPRAHIRVFDVAGRRDDRNGRVLAEGIGAGDLERGDLVDGMKCDERGNVWVTGPGGVLVFDPDGRAPRHDRGARERRQHRLGRPGLETGCSSPAARRCTASSAGSPEPRLLHEVSK